MLESSFLGINSIQVLITLAMILKKTKYTILISKFLVLTQLISEIVLPLGFPDTSLAV